MKEEEEEEYCHCINWYSLLPPVSSIHQWASSWGVKQLGYSMSGDGRDH